MKFYRNILLVILEPLAVHTITIIFHAERILSLRFFTCVLYAFLRSRLIGGSAIASARAYVFIIYLWVGHCLNKAPDSPLHYAVRTRKISVDTLRIDRGNGSSGQAKREELMNVSVGRKWTLD